MKIRIHLMGGINLVCEKPDLNFIVSYANKCAKKNELLEILFPGQPSKYLNPHHIIAVEEYNEPIHIPEVQGDNGI